jgi:glycosyltransferase involved in cell wall biosynthesis
MRIALIGRDANRVLAFRGSLVRLAQREGHEVIAITAPAAGDEVGALARAGVGWFGAPLDGGSLNPFADLAYRRALERILREQRIDAVLAYNPKCLAHGPIAARHAGVARVVGMVTGLGHGFIGHGWRERMVRLAKSRLYRRAFVACDQILVQNPQDLAELERCGALDARCRNRVECIPGSGVDLERFTTQPLPSGAHFLMIARPLREKGLPEYFKAARMVKREYPEATFSWMGPMEDANPSALARAEIERLLAAGVVRHIPESADVRQALADCSVFVLPSHREGTSKVTLEAMAMGRGVVTTDAPGCAHLVRGGIAGLATRVGDPEALASMLRTCAGDVALRVRVGDEARMRVEREYDAKVVDRLVLQAITCGTAATFRS